jgi:hypothetical protein
MATSLYAITNASLAGQNTPKYWDEIVDKLKALDWDRTFTPTGENGYKQDQGEWYYEVEEKTEYNPYQIRFEGPYAITFDLMPNTCLIYTIYRYSLLYDDAYFLDKFLAQLFEILELVGGTEIIFLADNACNKLCELLELSVLELEWTFEQVKESLTQQLGDPIMDLNMLQDKKLDYNNITEWICLKV